MRYGLPWQGSKSQIAPWVVAHLPPADLLVDLFAGGCAVTHAALLSGRFARVLANDPSGGPAAFREACLGGADAHVVTRDGLVRAGLVDQLLWSFGSARSSYVWSRGSERLRLMACEVVLGEDVSERYAAWRRLCKALDHEAVGSDGAALARLLTGEPDGTGAHHGLQELEPVARLGRVLALAGTDVSGLGMSALDYRDVVIPDGATVYADPPYRDRDQGGYGGGSFDSAAFDAWLADVPFMAVVSEETCPEGCVEVARRDRRRRLSSHENRAVATERLFVQGRFAGEWSARMEGKVHEG